MKKLEGNGENERVERRIGGSRPGGENTKRIGVGTVFGEVLGESHHFEASPERHDVCCHFD